MSHASAGLPSLNITINMSSDKKPINLLRGWPSPDVLPAPLLSSAAQKLLADPDVYTPALQYGPDAGYQPLRESLARWLTRHYKQDYEPDYARVCVTGGASQNLACILQGFTDPAYTKAIWCAAPCYHLACPIFEDAGFKGRLKASPEDEDGIDLQILEEKIRAFEDEHKDHSPQTEPFKGYPPSRKLYRYVIYVVTTSANPSGKTWSLKRREGLVRLARKYDALVISDDVYDFLQWPTSGEIPPEWPPEMRVPRVTDVDRALGPAENDPDGFGYAVSNGSFSKIVGPGVRTGWAEASPAFVKGLSAIGATKSGGAPSQLTASIISQLVDNGELEKHIETRMRPTLQHRYKIMMDAVHKYISPLGPEVQARESSLHGTEVFGGFFVWFELDLGLPAKLIAETALIEENIVIGFGNMFEVHGDEESAKFNTQIRLCFAWEPEDMLVEGVRRLGELLQRMLRNKDHYIASARGGQVQSFVDQSK